MPITNLSLSLSLFRKAFGGCFRGSDKSWNRDGDVERRKVKESFRIEIRHPVSSFRTDINSFLPRLSDRLAAGGACRNFKVGKMLLRFRSKNAGAARNASLIRPRRGKIKRPVIPALSIRHSIRTFQPRGLYFYSSVSFDAFPEDR